MHPADIALQQSFPTVMAPRFGALQPMQASGERLLIGQNGIFLEIARPWIRLVRRLASYVVETPIPYGVVQPVTELHCGQVPLELIGQFARMARDAHPNETGAWIVWNVQTRAFRLIPVRILEHGPGHLRYDRPRLEEADVLVMDCHSHGRHRACFSSTDNADDRFDVKFALVVGECDRQYPSLALRLCAKGIMDDVNPIPVSWFRATAACGEVA